MSIELMLERIQSAQVVIENNRDVVQKGGMRQKYHFMPEVGWLNDPNGLIYFQGKYHFFYQYNPYDSFWGAMHWGHAVSDDLLNWTYLPLALAPSESYDDHPQGGCFSGSAIEHDGKLYLFYTSAANTGNGVVQNQSMAYSEDGIHFQKYVNNPVIPVPPSEYEQADFRDPKVWKHGNFFYMVVSGKKNGFANALLYRSENLKDWEFFNVLAESRGELGYMWECPDFFPIQNDQGEEKYVLTFSPMGVAECTTVYLIGEMNYNTGKFNYTTVGTIDSGMDYYAPQSFVDSKGRRIMVAWANEWQWMPWWQDWGPTYQEGWCGSFNLLREVSLDKDNRLSFTPIEELTKLRSEEQQVKDLVLIDETLLIPTNDGVVFELQMIIDLKKTTAKQFKLKLRCNETLETVATFDLAKQMLEVNRDNSDNWSKGISRSSLLLQDDEKLDIRLFVDQSSVELFTDHDKTNHSLNVFADNTQNKNYLVVEEGQLFVHEITTWKLATPI